MKETGLVLTTADIIREFCTHSSTTQQANESASSETTINNILAHQPRPSLQVNLQYACSPACTDLLPSAIKTSDISVTSNHVYATIFVAVTIDFVLCN